MRGWIIAGIIFAVIVVAYLAYLIIGLSHP